MFGEGVTALLLILQERITCISIGPRLTLEHLTSDKQIVSSTISGKHARLIKDVMGCAILRIDDPVSPLWLHARLLTKRRSLRMLALEY